MESHTCDIIREGPLMLVEIQIPPKTKRRKKWTKHKIEIHRLLHLIAGVRGNFLRKPISEYSSLINLDIEGTLFFGHNPELQSKRYSSKNRDILCMEMKIQSEFTMFHQDERMFPLNTSKLKVELEAQNRLQKFEIYILPYNIRNELIRIWEMGYCVASTGKLIRFSI